MKKVFTVQIYMDGEARDLIQSFDGLYGCTAVPKKTDVKDGEFALVDFSIDREAISRGAGRPRKDRSIDKTVAEVFAYAQSHTQKATAAWLGLSLRTYQRYVKSLTDWGMWRAGVMDFFGKQA